MGMASYIGVNLPEIPLVHAGEQADMQSSFLSKPLSLSLSSNLLNGFRAVDDGLDLNTRIGVCDVVEQKQKDDLHTIDR